MSGSDNHDDGEQHVPICFTVYDRKHKLHTVAEMCSCKLPEIDMRTFPKGAYIAAIEFNEDVTH
jgi:hypothetical protein